MTTQPDASMCEKRKYRVVITKETALVKTFKDRMLKMRMKLLKAWTRGKEKKAVKLQHKLLEAELKNKKKSI